MQPIEDYQSPETEIIDKLFLELSQFAKAKTSNELRLELNEPKLLYQVEQLQARADRYRKALEEIAKAESQGYRRVIAEQALKKTVDRENK